MDEKGYMGQLREAWARHCRDVGLKKGSAKREKQLRAFMCGALAVLSAAQVMTPGRERALAFVVMVGRGEEFLEIKGTGAT